MHLWNIARAGLFVLGLVMTSAATPQPAASTYNPLETFAPFDFGQAPTVYRTADGLPGPQFWQNRADYTIDARLDPATHSISGTAEIRYTNNSPNTLDVLWLNIEQNRYKPDSRGNSQRRRRSGRLYRRHGPGLGGGRAGQVRRAVQPLISDTRAQVRLPVPLPPKGMRRCRIAYHYTVPKDPWGGRTGWMESPNGEIYSIAQWYPRMAVYDDIRGWDPLPYLAQEFYLEYGDFDYSVTVPANISSPARASSQNPNAVLSAAQRARLAQARQSDKTVMIRSASEPFGSPSGTQDLAFRDEGQPRRRVRRFARVRLGRGAHSAAGRPHGAGAVGLSAGSQGVGPLDRIYEGCGRALLGQMVPLPVAGRDRTSPARPAAWNIPASCSTTSTRRPSRPSGSRRTRSATAGSR